MSDLLLVFVPFMPGSKIVGFVNDNSAPIESKPLDS